MTTLDLNDLWVLYNYNLKSVSPCDNKKCDCDIQFIKNQEYQKLLSSVFFSLLFCGFRLDKKEDNLKIHLLPLKELAYFLIKIFHPDNYLGHYQYLVLLHHSLW